MSRHGDLFKDLSEGSNPLGLEILQETAGSLQLSGDRLQKALDELKQAEQLEPQAGLSCPEREGLVKAAAEAFWGYVVQRELLGLMDQDYIAQVYQVPPEVRRQAGV